MWERTLTPRDLPLTTLANTESGRGRAHVDGHPPVEDKEHHLHLPRILDPLLTSRWYADHPRAEEWKGESLGELKGCGLDIAELHGIGGEADFYG